MNALLKRFKHGRGDGGQDAKSVLPGSTVLIPLYIYPLDADSWKPLHTAISKHPHLNFVVIINPHNGPGADALPDASYTAEIPKLNAYANVQTVGYVRTDYCRRDMGSVCEDIAKFAGWSQATTTPTPTPTPTTSTIASTSINDTQDRQQLLATLSQPVPSSSPSSSSSSSPQRQNLNLGVCGIFFDETPNLYTASVAVYLNSITRYVKNMQGILGSRMVIHNPGTVPDPSLTNPGPDVTAIFEATYESYRNPATDERITSLLRYQRDRCSYIVHSVPREHITSVVRELKPKAKYLYVTDVSEGVYTKFGPNWDVFIDAMAALK